MTFPGIEHDPDAQKVNEDLLAVEKRRQEREAEYDEYVAIADIPWGTVLAATPGMRVRRRRWSA
ncbi:hypothetical protein [Micromonospora sp. 4G55]|uniref:hypothetical protein n=1 Tax=Micromonospora sp. 4G55 TaxID=2806102 RepID=UPI001A606C51|nr:hypothetical protein [Micromonospora sp. 4G55]MBM0257052.1 hypothetical protein [Micromonospora sp. 4G55]